MPLSLYNEQGDIAWSAHYTVFGRAGPLNESQIKQPLRLQGQYFDEESGLHYNRHRYYDPDTGMFVSQNPIGLAGGLNVYAYAPNPLSWIDPLGLTCRGALDWGGKDPYGLSRKDHIRRNGIDDPTRNVPHGVFNKDVINQTADAWKRAGEQGITPQIQGN